MIDTENKSTLRPSTPSPLGSHEVENQVPPLENYNLFLQDPALKEAVIREGGGWAETTLVSYGEKFGSAEIYEAARLANTVLPILHTHDRWGNRIDEVEFHPSYHHVMSTAIEHGNHALAWMDERSGSHVARAAMAIMHSEIEPATQCPLTMTHAVVPSLRNQPDVAEVWLPMVFTNQYDGTMKPAPEKRGLTFGMAMTEKQGGSDVRSNTTRAVAQGAGGPGGEYLLTGHKWFCSAPMCDAFLTLARTDKGLSCFLLPRFRPDGSKNNFFVQRLKSKIGNRANASSEVEYKDTWSQMVGEEGRGIPTIIEMVHHTRLDVSLGATGIMRQALSQAMHHAHHRSAFGKKLAEHGLMKNVLADLALEVEAAMAMSMRLARAFDSGDDEAEHLFARLGTAICKYWVAKRCTNHVTEALECHGGNGYVEDSVMARLFKEAPLGSIWEGSGNVQCLDVLRAMHKTPAVVDALVAELEKARGGDGRYDTFLDGAKAALKPSGDPEVGARRMVEKLAVALSGSLLVQHAPQAVSDAFCASRLGGDWGHEYGTLPAGLDLDAILERARPRVD
jgi:putative acyl-CoA dehydrogenase